MLNCSLQIQKYLSQGFVFLFAFVFSNQILFAQNTLTTRPSMVSKKVAKSMIIDGIMNEESWKEASIFTNFTEFRPTPFTMERDAHKTVAYLMYNNDGIYVAGKCYEETIDSVTRELIGRDGFGNNDFFGLIFDTYNDKQNGFEYFVTPLGEQMDAKVSAGDNGEDFSWNAVWECKSKVEKDGWSFEIFIPFAAIRFGKDKIQKWGINLTRRRVKAGKQYSWASVNPQINGFLTQNGTWEGLTDIKPPIRLQFSPYVGNYTTVFSKTLPGEKKVVNQINGGMDVKYGINQAFTLDMTLIPDFGQVQTDNRVLNLGPFEQQFSEQRPFFTEGLELFNKGGLFYSRRIGKNPYQASYVYYNNVNNNESILKDPQETKIINATKISGRMQNGLAIGVLNAITNKQFATVENNLTKEKRKELSYPTTNYNMIVLDKTLKNNSSVSFVNTNVLRGGGQYDANVSMGLFDINDKTNTWNIGGKFGQSKLKGIVAGKNIAGYIGSMYMGKTSGRFNFNFWGDVADNNYSQNDMGYATNNNFFDKGMYAGYGWNKPHGFYNRLRVNFNAYVSHLLIGTDPLKSNNHLYQGGNINVNINGQTKKLWYFGSSINRNLKENDYYEARSNGKVFKRAGGYNFYIYTGSNDAKKYSINVEIGLNNREQFNAFGYSYSIGQQYRFNQKFSLGHNLSFDTRKNQAGFGTKIRTNGKDSVYFTRRDRQTIVNSINVKYSFTNKMFFTFNIRHYWSGVNAKELYFLTNKGMLEPSTRINPNTLKQNYNAFALNAVYTWQVANGSFLNIVWKDEADDFVASNFENKYFKNLDKTLNANHTNSVSVRLIYFIDYLSLKKKS